MEPIGSDDFVSGVVTTPLRPFGLGRLSNNGNNDSDCPVDILPSLPAYFSGMYINYLSFNKLYSYQFFVIE